VVHARASADWLLAQGRTADALAGASPFLSQLGDLLAAEALCRQALASPHSESLNAALATAFAHAVLSGASGLSIAVRQGAAALETLTADQLN
jgi:hypothetical protein